ncbi:MAG: hypothetical protein LBR80_02030 [Deltaproteobacteria bacterium]|jgi:hypothetical protein|nr:hypothetical protein [Deltaproteobacteria bacterium]
MHLQPLLFFLAFIAAVALAALTIRCGTALASPRKSGKGPGKRKEQGKGKGKTKGKRPGKGKGGNKPPSKRGPAGTGTFLRSVAVKGGDDSPSGRPLPEGWPEWNFPHMEKILESQRHLAESMVSDGKLLEAAHAWDELRALALLLFGPGDPRVWASLSRSAGALAILNDGPGDPDSGRIRKFVAPAASSVAAGARAGLEEAFAAHPPDSRLWKPSLPWERGDMPGDWEKRRDRELAFAEGTLARLPAGSGLSRGEPAPPLRSLAEAMYPGDREGIGEAPSAEDPFPSFDELRARWKAAEGPGGPGAGSREELALRSLLGAELWDTDGREEAAEEAISLMREASAGLDRAAGDRDRDSLAAKESLARRLGGMVGYGSVPPAHFVLRPRADRTSARNLFRSLLKLAPAGPEGERLRRRAAIAVAGLSLGLDEGQGHAAMDLAFAANRLLSKGSGKDEELEAARCSFDVAEFMLHDGAAAIAERHFFFALGLRRFFLGWSHPEVAVTLGRMGDALNSDGKVGRACANWALALEALEGRGDRYEFFRADLEFRLGRTVMLEAETLQAIPILERAEERYRRVRGEMSQHALEAAAFIGISHYHAMDVRRSGKAYMRIVKLLDGVLPVSDPDPALAPYEDLLSVALAGAGAAAIACGETAGGRALIKRSVGLGTGLESGFTFRNMAEMFRQFDHGGIVKILDDDDDYEGVDFGGGDGDDDYDDGNDDDDYDGGDDGDDDDE